MFEVDYAGKCFGNKEEASKECRKCKIKQYCKSVKPFDDKTGIEILRDLALESGTVILKPNEEVRASFVFLKGSIDLLEDGGVIIRTGNDEKKVNVVSHEEALKLFNSIAVL